MLLFAGKDVLAQVNKVTGPNCFDYRATLLALQKVTFFYSSIIDLIKLRYLVNLSGYQ